MRSQASAQGHKRGQKLEKMAMQFILSHAYQTVFSATPGAEPSLLKKACDKCRERRVRCKTHPSGSCESCLTSGKKCTFKYVFKKRGRKKATTTYEYNVNSLHVRPQFQRHSSASSTSIPTPPSNLPLQYTDPTMPHFNDLEKYSLALNQISLTLANK
ncbi:hypothetical protein DSO57_1022013 [Entomophthora muscae]|uniref:Uncharacterized protein n=1 Tax=Entomophthora muscae TaxID=34485 RepID=A0ACC2TEN1_9FUNG|nr:hypothetical protein DSO57_1022013 [Entomophthora muscae]